jgi:probable rRNA maturation factor
MNAVEVQAEGIELPPWAGAAEAFALSVLARLEKDDWDLSILLTSDEFRSIDEATDVLSFAQGETVKDPESGGERLLAGDIVISLEAMARNAEDYRADRDEELRRLILHGILHLAGMDHMGNESLEPMLQFQESMLKSMPEARILR